MEKRLMPGSNNFGKKQFKEYCIKTNPKKILDMGPGRGTYHTLLKDVLPDTCFEAVEVWGPYVSDFELDKKYSKVIVSDVRYVNLNLLGHYDLIICGDILEHMTKEDAVTLVERLLDHCTTLYVSIPTVHYPQGTSRKNPYERHVKDDWSHSEMLDTFKDLIVDSLHLEGKVVSTYYLKKKV